MLIRWIFAALHLLALGIGLAGVWARGRALRGNLDKAGLQRVFLADNWWGIAALLWIVTGLVRLLASMEKSSSYYYHNVFFNIKMTVFLVIFLLEIAPMVTLIKWRRIVRAGRMPETTRAIAFARISTIQAVLLVLMIFAATAMARGFGAR